ncbi:MAG: hypothetical protein Q4B70_18655 [Lachnospiraceae bacterium]|nr:hypothetical protein [Lachnospiraceae bacterium]
MTKWLVKIILSKVFIIILIIIPVIAFFVTFIVRPYVCLKMSSYLFCYIVSIELLLFGLHVIISPYQQTTKAFWLSIIVVVYLYINTYFLATDPNFVDPFGLDKLCEDQRNFVMTSLSLSSFIFSIYAIFHSHGESVLDKKKEKKYTVDVVKGNSNKVSTYIVTVNENNTKIIEEKVQVQIAEKEG